VPRRWPHRGDAEGRRKKSPGVLGELWLSEGARTDWPYFARWHYRGHDLGFVKKIILLWKATKPIGICIFATPVAALSLRNRYFGLSGRMNGDILAALTKNIWVLARVVIHPTYRGAGIAAAFVKRACDLCPVPWIEALAAMGRANPFFEKAGFVKVGVIRKRAASVSPPRKPERHDAYREPLYYVLDNRKVGCDKQY